MFFLKKFNRIKLRYIYIFYLVFKIMLLSYFAYRLCQPYARTRLRWTFSWKLSS